jgi:hypothetical protein
MDFDSPRYIKAAIMAQPNGSTYGVNQNADFAQVSLAILYGKGIC